MISHSDRAVVAVVLWGGTMTLLALVAAALEAWAERHQKPRRRSSW